MENLTTSRTFLKGLSLLTAMYGSGSFRNQTIPRIGYLGGADILELEKVFIEELHRNNVLASLRYGPP